MTRYAQSFTPQAHLVDGLHKEAVSILSAMSSWMLMIHLAHGPQEAARIQAIIMQELEGENAVSKV